MDKNAADVATGHAVVVQYVAAVRELGGLEKDNITTLLNFKREQKSGKHERKLRVTAPHSHF